MATLRATCVGFSRLPTPLESRRIGNYYAIIDVDTIFNLADWREINVRDPKEFGYVPNQIRQTLLTKDTFFLINRGLTISAKAVRYNNQANALEIDVEDPAVHGLMDGGHTFLQLEKFKQSTEEREVDRQFVKVEIVTGLDRNEIVNLVDGRNTSNQVKEVSLEELKGSFNELKSTLSNQSYADLIAYSEYETMRNSEGKVVAKPISVVEILKCLVCLDIANFDENRHPMQIATRDNKVIEHFRGHESDLKPLYPLLPEILQLWDTIYRDFVPSYNASGGAAGRIGGTGGRIFKELSKKRYKPLPFIAQTAGWSFADSLRLPIMGAFRAAIRRTGNGRYGWKGGINPSEFFTQEVAQKLTRVVCQNLIETQDVTRTSRTDSVWAHCYTEVELAILKRSSRETVEV